MLACSHDHNEPLRFQDFQNNINLKADLYDLTQILVVEYSSLDVLVNRQDALSENFLICHPESVCSVVVRLYVILGTVSVFLTI